MDLMAFISLVISCACLVSFFMYVAWLTEDFSGSRFLLAVVLLVGAIWNMLTFLVRTGFLA